MLAKNIDRTLPWDALVRLLERHTILVIHSDEDQVALTVGTKSYEGPTLADAVMDAASDQVVKRCPGCQATKRLADFNRDRSRPDGRMGKCKLCERARVMRYDRAQRARRDAAPETPGA